MWLLHSVYEPEPNFKALLFTWRYNGVDMYPCTSERMNAKGYEAEYDIIWYYTNRDETNNTLRDLHNSLYYMNAESNNCFIIDSKKSNVSIDVLSSRLHNLANSNAK